MDWTGSMERYTGELEAGRFDLLVIGGGIVGACVAWDAALRGLTVALLERGDFGAGASANSLKIVHGGLRHLQRLDLARVRESNRERAAWLRIAPHLVEPLPVVVPAYGRGARGRAALRGGLAVAELLGWDLNAGLPAEHRLPPARTLDRRACLDLAPELEAPSLSGGVLFHDGRMYSSERLTLTVVAAARAAGAVVSNHVEVVGPLRAGPATIGVAAIDKLNGKRLEVRARLIVNAAGAAAEEVARRFVPGTTAFPPLSAAVNLVFPSLGHTVAFALPAAAADPGAATRPDRLLFVVPWRGLSMVGTGHFPLAPDAGADLEPAVERFLGQVRRSFPDHRTDLDRPIAVHRGRVPATAAPGAGSRDEDSVRLLRSARLLDHARDGDPALLSIVSVKYTTARLAAERAVDAALDRLGRRARPCMTASTPLPGAPGGSLEALRREARARYGGVLADDVLDHLVRVHGTGYESVLAHQDGVGGSGWGRRVVPFAPVIVAQLVHGVRHEMACTVDDLLERRTELGARGLVTPEARRLAAAALGPRAVPAAHPAE